MEDEKDLSVDNDDSSVQEVDNTDDADVNNDNPSTDDASSRKAGNGYNGLASSNREAFARGLNDNYSDRIARNRANLEAARARSNSNQKEIKDKDGNESLKDKNGLDKLGDKANVLKNKASLLSSQVDNLRSKAFMVTNPGEAAKMVVKKKVTTWILATLAASLPVILPILAFIVVIFAVIGIHDEMENNNSYVSNSTSESGFTISDTSLTKTEFINKLQEYANMHPHWQIFVDNAPDYYDYAKAKGVNPEIVVLIADKENGGRETTSGTNNYWGWGCPNGAKECVGLFDFMYGAKKVIDSASKHDTLMDWFVIGHYSYIGDYWYNPGGSGSGGCYYASHIYSDNMPTRVQNACAEVAGNECSKDGTESACVKTLEEDQVAYSEWIVYTKMATSRKNIFGLEVDEGVVNPSNSSDIVGTNNIVEGYVNWMINFAADDTHGYSQANRNMNPDVDCSSFVYYGLLNGAGFNRGAIGGYPFTTASMRAILQNIGFKVYSYNESQLRRGDILWKNGHTEVYIGDGMNVGAHSNRDGKTGDSSGREVNVSGNYKGWTHFIRYEGNG